MIVDGLLFVGRRHGTMGVFLPVLFFAGILLVDAIGLNPTAETLLGHISAGNIKAFAEEVRASPNPESLARIINGENAERGAFPYQVSLQWFFFGLRFPICGASVIGENVVLTAAHCVYGLGGPDDFQVVLYDHNLAAAEGTEQAIGISRIHMFHDYYPYVDFHNHVYPHDIAILILKENIRDPTAIIQLADDTSSDFSGVSCTISGWGLNDSNAQFLPEVLQAINMTVLSRDECMDHWGPYGANIFPGQICIFRGTDPNTGGAACSGDSGGPMVCNGLLAGVTSWGYNGCRIAETREFLPSVYARVSYYYPWIQMMLSRYDGIRRNYAK